MHRFFLLALLSLALSASAFAQDDDGPFVYASYSVCEPATVADADDAFTRDYEPALNAHVASGDLAAWGRLTHSDGGVWTRATYTIAPTLDALMAFQDTWQDELERDHAAARTTIRTSCTQHVDYVWRVVASSRAPGEVARNRPPFGGSTYFQCGQAGLDRADALVREHFAPNLNAMVRDGVISNWTWQAHVMGGPFTRMLVMDTDSPLATLRAWERLGDGIDEDASTEFDTLCGTHQDYIWGVSSSR
jgi:hypothetical protein